MKWSKEKCLIHVLGFFVARCAFMSMNPLAIGFFLGGYQIKAGGIWLLLSIVGGLATVLPYTEALKYGLVLLVIMCITRMFAGKGKRFSLIGTSLLGGGVTLAVSLSQLVWESNVTYYVSLAVIEGVLAFVSVVLLKKGLEYLSHYKRGRSLTHEEAISLSILLFAFLIGVPKVAFDYFAVLETVVYLLILCVSYRFGSREGVLMGAICGAVITYRYDEISLLGIFTIIGLGASLLRNLGRLGSSITFLTTVLCVDYFYSGFLLTENSLKGIVAALIIFLLLPKPFMERIVEDEDEKEEKVAMIGDALQTAAKNKLREFADTFKKLQTVMDYGMEKRTILSGTETQHLFDGLVDQVCQECTNCKRCWEQEYKETYQATNSIFAALEKEGGLSVSDIPPDFGEKCIHLEGFLFQANRGFELAKMNLAWSNRMLEGREAIAGQLGEVAQIIDDFSLGLYEEISLEKGKEDELIYRMTENNVRVKKAIILKNKEQREEVYITAKSLKGRMMTTKEAASIVSHIFLKPMRVTDSSKMIIGKDYEVVSFVEDTLFSCLTGARRCAKEDESVSGDNFSFTHLKGGKLVMMLADGMGSGPKAYKESEAIIELLEQLLESGFKEKSAIKLMNALLSLNVDKQQYSTLDVSFIDLFSGVCEIVKMGASTTYIKRDNWVETIASTSLPMGLIHSAVFDNCTKKLYDGDIIIMVSDGVIEGIKEDNKEEYLKELILNTNTSSPKELVDRLINKVIELTPDGNKDDMTAIAVGVWKK